ncbi:MAG: transcription-repair coupling factor [Verrucomicrobia bacterium]|nr:transcription-repair coupling factor [Verrucomicrobiota bacterium]
MITTDSTALLLPPRAKHTGVCPTARGAVLAELARRDPAPVWLVISDTLKSAEQLAEDTTLFYVAVVGGKAARLETLILPEAMGESREMAEAFAASADRQAVLSRLRATRNISQSNGTAPPLLIFTTPAALLQRVPALEDYTANELTLTKGQAHPFLPLLEKLRALDYDSEAVCEAPGTYAVRGGIIDLYPVNAAQPYRLDFFGDDLESICELDPVTQRSGGEVEKLTLAASPRLALAPSLTGLAPYLSTATRLVLVEPAPLDLAFSLVARQNANLALSSGPDADATGNALAPILARIAALVALCDLDEASALFDSTSSSSPVVETTWDTESLVHHRHYPSDHLIAHERLNAEEQARHDFLVQLARWQNEGAAIAVVAPKDSDEKRIQEIIAAHPAAKKLRLHWLRGQLNEGFRCTPRPDAALSLAEARTAKNKRPAATNTAATALAATSLVVVTETELFGRQRTRRATSSRRATVHRAQVDQLLDFADLVEGDFVVHLQHGIALFRGITQLDTRDGLREVISLEFDDHVTLHVPLPEAHLISRYVGLSKVRPQLGRIGSDRWQKTRQQAERSTLDLAAELLRIQAARDAQPGIALPPDNDWQREFEGAFPFSETPDQLKAIVATKADQERPRPMDRLVCGDVGFGKTEVAIRAAFKAVQGGKQVAILVPTTILAQQHANTFRERMAGYPVAVEMLSRFRTQAESTRIIAATAAGQVDILIGTHRLLNKDIHFKDLGLVVIDEEQRFGVKHKEQLKALRVSVDVLSMSATPIPRTLYMAMTGARDMSVIETPPTNRHPIQTIVKTYDEQLVVDAIRHELRRGGQVFYLHNRVQTIALVAARLRELLPDVDIGVGHGKMNEHELEEMMTAFVAGRHQVLVCTTIIETGLDIPNCNTIIIEGADRFGLSQLYQLRGRVGRFKHQAYAYLLLHRHSRLMEAARERLNALRTHNQLGAGFRIAMRDLELRGAGNLLGSQQSGHIVGVGFELYCQLLRQSVARLKGDKQAASIRASVKLDFVFVGEGAPPEKNAPTAAASHAGATSYLAIRQAEDAAAGAVTVSRIQARLPVAYIGETRLRLDFYRRLALAGSPATLKELEAELTDRFGKFNDDVRALLQVTAIRIAAEQKGIVSVETEGSKLKLLRAGPGRRDDYVQLNGRFPRLTAPRPLARLKEILTYLGNLPGPI